MPSGARTTKKRVSKRLGIDAGDPGLLGELAHRRRAV